MTRIAYMFSIILFGVICIFAPLSAQTPPFRPPAIPLATSDPYFSIWSFSDHPGSDWPRHWTGKVNALCGFVRIDGKPYRVLGNSLQDISPMSLLRTSVFPTRTVYEFEEEGVRLIMTFTSPLLPHDLEVLSRPVTYVSWSARSVDGVAHRVSVYFDNSAELVVNSSGQEVVWSRLRLEGLDVLSIGSREQDVLGKSGDDLRIDWGYYYLVAPRSQDGRNVITGHARAREAFATDGTVPASDDARMPRPANDDWPVLAFSFDMGEVEAVPVERFLVMAYDDQFSIEYFRRKIRPYWRSDGTGTGDLLVRAVREYPRLVDACVKFDTDLLADMRSAGGVEYAELAALSYRQAIAAHKLAADIDGTPLLFPKENFSNGCISTVDVIYPASPVFMLFNMDLLKATLAPVLEYASMSRWKFPFAPHDLGTYPKANGQVYGGGERSEENQMPVEESGNMLIMLYAIAKAEGDAGFSMKYWNIVSRWAQYLKAKGLDPENQLCTDDFAGHLAHNVNLSLKAILALGSYAKLCDMTGKREDSEAFMKLAREYAARWMTMADDGDHFRLAFDKPGTWSQKYNLVWDRILGLDLFPDDVGTKEIRYYLTKQNEYGLPLDNRADYTKSDWLVWTATLAPERQEFERLIAPLRKFLQDSPDRVPFSDWYDTKTGKVVGFRARPVIGGVFVRMLSDEQLWRKWRVGL